MMFKRWMMAVMLALLGLALAGCDPEAVTAKVFEVTADVAEHGEAAADRAAAAVGSAVGDYCKAPERLRGVLRAAVNRHAAPHVVAVTCAGDG